MQPETTFPDLFIFTDYYPWSSSDFLDNALLFEDENTSIVVEKIERLPNLHTALDAGIVDFPRVEEHTNMVVFLELKVTSEQLGDFNVPVIYAFVENEAFCSKVLLENQAEISHKVRVRYGGGCGGGGNCRGTWINNVLHKLNCKILVTDTTELNPVLLETNSENNSDFSRDELAVKLYPNLAYDEKKVEFSDVRTLEGHLWSNHGDVTWNVINHS